MFNVIDELEKVTVPVSMESLKLDSLGMDNNPTTGVGLHGGQPEHGSTSSSMSYADSLLADKTKKVNFRSLASPIVHEGCDVVLPRDSVRMVQNKLANTLYGYFLGDRVAFPVVEYFVRINWKQYGLQKSMMNANGFFFFKFNDDVGMRNALKAGPWIIRSQPLILNEWTPTTKLEKKEVKKVQVWVKIHEVPLAAYTEDGLSLVATTIGVPKMLDTYTTTMCNEVWGRSSYARALLEISAENELKEEITIAIPEPDGEGFVKETMYVEYEWSPLRCASCCVFGHSNDSCPKQPKKIGRAMNDNQYRHIGNQGRTGKKAPVIDEDGYIGVYGKKAAKKTGIQVNKQKSKFEYRPVVAKPVVAKPKGDIKSGKSVSGFESTNPFDVLNEVNTEDKDGSKKVGDDGGYYDSDDDEVTEVYNETNDFILKGSQKPTTNTGASTPNQVVTHD